MAGITRRAALLAVALVPLGCVSAEDRLVEGIGLQSQGRYIDAVYRYAEAVERDGELAEARDRLMAAGDSALMVGMDDADDLELRGDPVGAARHYETLDQMLSRVRQVGMRLDVPADYSRVRRGVFDNAIEWQMARGEEALDAGRWDEAAGYFGRARASFLPSRAQVEASQEAETGVFLRWAETELEDGNFLAGYEIAQRATEVRSPSRETVLAVRELQEEALANGSVVLAMAPVTADPDVREWLGGEFEVALENDLGVDHWTRPPLFVEVADPILLRQELSGLLGGREVASPLLVGRALELIGADLGVMIRLREVEVTEEDVTRREHDAVVARNVRQGARRTTVMDTVTYTTISGTLAYYVESDIILVDPSGREVNRFSASADEAGPFERGEFDGDPNQLDLPATQRRFFSTSVIEGQMADIEEVLLEELAVAIATGTFDQVLAGIR